MHIAEAEMPINDTDKGWIRDHVSQAINGKLQWWKTWIPAATCIVVLATVAYWKGGYDQRLQHIEDGLKDVKEQLLAIRLVGASATDPQSPARVKRVIESAKKQSIRLKPQLARDVGEKFIESAPTSNSAWNIVTSLVNYQSETAPWAKDVMRVIAKRNYPWCQNGLPKDAGVRITEDRKKLSINGPIVYEYCVVQLDDPAMVAFGATAPGGVVLENCLIRYSGGDVLMAGKYIRSVFEFVPSRPPSERGLMLARAILQSDEKVQ